MGKKWGERLVNRMFHSLCSRLEQSHVLVGSVPLGPAVWPAPVGFVFVAPESRGTQEAWPAYPSECVQRRADGVSLCEGLGFWILAQLRPRTSGGCPGLVLPLKEAVPGSRGPRGLEG